MTADVADLGHVVPVDLALEAERILLRIGRVEIVAYDGLIQQARIEGVALQEAAQLTAHLGASRVGRQGESGRLRAGDRVEEDLRRRSRNVEQDVIEGRIVGDRITSAKNRGSIAEQRAEQTALDARRVGEPDARRDVVLVGGKLRHSARRERQTLAVEGRVWIAFAL